MSLGAKYTARKASSTSVGEAIEQLLDAYKIRGRYNETYITARWQELVGTAIAQRTESVTVREGILYIRLSSAPLRQELLLAKTKFVEMLNKEIGANVLTDIVFV
jgi:predicted nucleic acid-binding Zn ribbon protein